MPYLRLSSLPLDDATRRHLADELTATVLDILPDQKPEWTAVHFTSYDPADFAIAGRLVADGATGETHLDISAPEVDEKSWFALRNRLTDVIVEALDIPESDRWHVNVKLNAYDPHTFAVAGNAADEIDADGHLDENDRRGGPGWIRPAVLTGFAIGAYYGYRWLTARIGSDAEADAAPPADDDTSTVSARESAPTNESAPAREY